MRGAADKRHCCSSSDVALIPGHGSCLLLVLLQPCPGGFSVGSGFPFFTKSNTCKFQLDLRSVSVYTIVYCHIVIEYINKENALYKSLPLLLLLCSGTVEKGSRSRMNVPLRISNPDGDQQLEKKFIEEATAKNMIQLKGHRFVT